MLPLVVAITGASGSIYAVRLLEVLRAAGRTVHLTISPAATQVFAEELDLQIDLKAFDPQVLFPAWESLPADSKLRRYLRPPRSHSQEQGSGLSLTVPETPATPGSMIYHDYRNYRAGIASGSFLTAGMVICPCSGGTLSGIATGQSQNLIHRAADVHLKERRKLVLVPRETPLSPIALGNMKTLADQGVVILPAMPGFYHDPLGLPDLVDFVVARIADQLGVPHRLMHRWGTVDDHGR